MSGKFRILDWDTDFFGFKVVKLNDNCLTKDSTGFLKEMFLDNVQLGYYTSTTPVAREIIKNKFYHIELVFKRVPILKEMNNLSEIHKNISLYDDMPPSEDLISLAILAGKQGRFGKDSRISEDILKEMFKNWITNSVKKNYS